MSAAWQAPETFVEVDGGKQEVSFKTDVFMFGCVIYEVLTGCVPYHWLRSAQSVILYRARDLSQSPLDAAVAEGKLCFVVADTPTRASLVQLARECMQPLPANRPDMQLVLRRLDTLRDACMEQAPAAAAAASVCAVTIVCLSFGPIGQRFTTSVTEACARWPGAAASVSRRRRERRSHPLAAAPGL